MLVVAGPAHRYELQADTNIADEWSIAPAANALPEDVVHTPQPIGEDETAAGPSASIALNRLLAEKVDAFVGAMRGEGGLVAMPESVALHGQPVFDEGSALDLVIAEDQVRVIQVWARAQVEPIVQLDVHLLADPDQPVAVHIFDVRAEHGVHVLVAETRDPDLVRQSIEARAARRRGVAHATRDAMSVFVDVDDGMSELLGWTADQLVGHRASDFVHPEDTPAAVENWMAMRAGSGASRVRARYRHANGHYVWLEVVNENRLADPNCGLVLSEMVDISEEMAQLEALHARERLLARLAESLPIGICHLRPDGDVVYSNEPWIALLGDVKSSDALLDRVDEADGRVVQLALEAAFRGQPSNLEVTILRGLEERRCELTFRAMSGDTGSLDGVIVCVSDVTERSRLRTELEHRASYDALSGCLNRAATVTALERVLREARQVAVAYVDLDHFKAINDDFGHAAGDELLRIAAARLRSATRSVDVVGRLGGDEFVVICPRGEDPFVPDELGGRLAAAINGDVVFARQRIALRASVGVATSRAGELDAEAVLHRADTAMYAAKRTQRRVTGLLGVVR